MGSYKQLLILLLGIAEAYWPKLYNHKKERKDKRMNIFELNLERYSHVDWKGTERWSLQPEKRILKVLVLFIVTEFYVLE